MTIRRHVKLEFRFVSIYENRNLILLNHAYGLKSKNKKIKIIN